MKRCLSCNTLFEKIKTNCPSCNQEPAHIESFDAYAPEFAYDGGGFNPDYFSVLAKLEEKHFWFKARNRLILWAINKHCKSFLSFLEVGCGTGYVLAGIDKTFPIKNLYGSEVFIAGLRFSSTRIPSAKFIQMDARNIPFADEFDAIGIFDVLEHIEEDSLVLKQIHTALNSSGILFLTVPQHDKLWSISDEYAHHVRRYSAKEIESKIIDSGFTILQSTSFVTILLPAMLISRRMNHKIAVEDYDPLAEFNLPTWLNRLFETLLNIEILFIRAGFSLPLGGSRFIVAQKVNL